VSRRAADFRAVPVGVSSPLPTGGEPARGVEGCLPKFRIVADQPAPETCPVECTDSTIVTPHVANRMTNNMTRMAPSPAPVRPTVRSSLPATSASRAAMSDAVGAPAGEPVVAIGSFVESCAVFDPSGTTPDACRCEENFLGTRPVCLASQNLCARPLRLAVLEPAAFETRRTILKVSERSLPPASTATALASLVVFICSTDTSFAIDENCASPQGSPSCQDSERSSTAKIGRLDRTTALRTPARAANPSCGANNGSKRPTRNAW
jgi:hypothetical protein